MKILLVAPTTKMGLISLDTVHVFINNGTHVELGAYRREIMRGGEPEIVHLENCQFREGSEWTEFWNF